MLCRQADRKDTEEEKYRDSTTDKRQRMRKKKIRQKEEEGGREGGRKGWRDKSMRQRVRERRVRSINLITDRPLPSSRSLAALLNRNSHQGTSPKQSH